MRSHRPHIHRHRTRTAVGAGLAAVVLGLAACSSSGKRHAGAPSTAASGGSTVEIKNFTFLPMALTVATGTTVTWKFDDSAPHTVKADDGSFTSPALSNGKTFSHTFTKAGTFGYICSIHQYMHGTVTVT